MRYWIGEIKHLTCVLWFNYSCVSLISHSKGFYWHKKHSRFICWFYYKWWQMLDRSNFLLFFF